MANKILRLDISKIPDLTPIIYGRVADGLVQTVDVYVTNNGEPFDLTGWVINFEGNTSGNRTYVKDLEGIVMVDRTKGHFTYTFPLIAFSTAGKYERAYFSFVKGDQRESTSDFNIQVFENADITVEEAHTVITEYEELVDELNRIFLEAQTELQQDFDEFKKNYDTRYNNYITDLTNKINAAQNKIDILNSNYDKANAKLTDLEERMNDLVNKGLLKMEDVLSFLGGQDVSMKIAIDFTGKISGSTVENPNVLRFNSSPKREIGDASLLNVGVELLSDGVEANMWKNYSNVSALDGKYVQSQHTMPDYISYHIATLDIVEEIGRRFPNIYKAAGADTMAKKIALVKQKGVTAFGCAWGFASTGDTYGYSIGRSTFNPDGTFKQWGGLFSTGTNTHNASTPNQVFASTTLNTMINNEGKSYYIMAAVEPSDGVKLNKVSLDYFVCEITLNLNINDLIPKPDLSKYYTKDEMNEAFTEHSLYSNSLDFGDYDYSTAPNLLKTVTRNHWSNWISSVSTPNNYVKVFDDYIIIDATDPSAVNVGRNVYIPNITRLTKGKQYTLSITMMVDDEFDLGENSYNQSAVHYTVQSDGTTERPMIIRPNKTMVNQWQRVSVKFTVPTSIKDGEYCFLHFYEGSTVTGKWYIRNDIMVQEGDQTSSQTTGWKPNLLDAPYYLSKVALSENIASKDVQFPITSTEYCIYSKANVEDYKANQKYVVTMKATKPANQSFVAYLNFQGTVKAGHLTPVEGMTDVWQLVFTVTQADIDAGAVRALNMYQYPWTTTGACQIDWLKIEKGDIRTPNIDQYKYRGICMRDSNNPKDYVWDIAPEYVEDNLATDVKISEITGKANKYTDDRVAIVNKNLSDTTADLNKQIANNKNNIAIVNKNLSDATADLNKQIANNKNNIATNTTNISTNTTAISTLQNKNLFTQNKSVHGLTWIAHRGNNSTAPENSIVAFENVYRHQAIETDIQLTSDNRWVIMHDETVDRTTNGTGKISDMTYDQFRALRIDTGANVDKLTDDEKIPPNLEEFLLICKKNNRIPVVEIKATGGYTKEQLQLIKTISDGIGMTEKTIFISFNYDMLVLMREIFPFNELQWVYQGTINTDVITKLKTLGLPCGLDINENNASLTKDNVNLLHANRLKIGAWTVGYNSFEKMKDLGIDYITTNSPSGYLKYAELSLLNGFTPNNDNGQVPQFAAELEGGYVFLSFNVRDGANNNQLTEIAKLPNWAIPHEKQYNQCMIRTSSGVSLGTFDTQGWKHSTGVTEGTITIGLGWSSRTTWAAGQCIYKID